MEKDLKTMLSEGQVTFTFKKANGEIRTATGTRILNSADCVCADTCPDCVTY